MTFFCEICEVVWAFTKLVRLTRHPKSRVCPDCVIE